MLTFGLVCVTITSKRPQKGVGSSKSLSDVPDDTERYYGLENVSQRDRAP